MISNLIRKNLVNLKPYACARDLYKEGMFMDANENSFGSTVKIPYRNQLNRYPDPYCVDLKKAILGYLNLSFLRVENIFVGSGSDEIIRLLMNLFLDVDDEIIVNEPTYGMYRVAADIMGIRVKAVELDKNFQMDLRGISRLVGKKTKLIFCCSPNNPTGNLLKIEDIAELCSGFSGYVVLDEAYVEFSSQGSMANMIEKFPNLLILRTFSKAWGLAGLRVGYMIGNDDVVTNLNKIKLPYNVNSLSQSLVIRALKNREGMREVVRQILEERVLLEKELLALDLEVLPSEANFLMVKIAGPVGVANRVVRSLAEDEGIVIRDFSSNLMLENCFRITVGTPKQNKLLIQSLTSIL